MSMRLSFDFIVSGFTIGCSIRRENLGGFTATAIDSLPSSSSLPSGNQFLVSLLCAVLSWVFFKQWRASKWNGVPFAVPIPEQAQKGWKGKEMDVVSIRSENNYNIQCYAPATGRFLGVVRPAEPADIDAAIDRAAIAQNAWAKTSWDERRKVLRTLQKYILDHSEDIAAVACLDSGKTKIDAAMGEILVTVEKIRWTLGHGEKVLSPEKRPVSWPLMAYKKAELRYEPLGVVAACVSWNYPFHNLLSPIISSIFAGNAIVVKGSEQTAWSSQYFISIVKGALIACGHSPDLVESVMCWPEVAPHLTSHPKLAHITFIGSKPVAHHVARSASTALTPLCIELGGKDAAILLNSCRSKLKTIVSLLMRGTFQSCGQNCIGIERIVACPDVYPDLVAQLTERVKPLRCGSILDKPEIDCGAVISAASFDRLEELVRDAVVRGAKLIAGGKRYNHPEYPKGHYFEPTLLVDVTPDMQIANTEVFGPICLVMRANSASHALQIANSTIYALGGSVFGTNKQELDMITRGMKCGMVSVNDFAVYYLNQSLPFGGVKGSGYGRFAGPEGLRAVSNLKAVAEDRFWGVSTAIPPVLDYPIRDTERGWRFVRGLIELGYGETWGRVIGGLGRLLGNM